jgi:hypothetical protein
MRILLVTSVVLLVGCGPSLPEPTDTQLDVVYRDSTSWNLSRNDEVYEFSPVSDPGIKCVFVASYKRGGLECWRVK